MTGMNTDVRRTAALPVSWWLLLLLGALWVAYMIMA